MSTQIMLDITTTLILLMLCGFGVVRLSLNDGLFSSRPKSKRPF
jgi:hypothetical protein